MNRASTVFNNCFPFIPNTPFDIKWMEDDGHGGGDYFQNMVIGKYAPVLANGEQLSTVSPSPDNRKIIVTGTRLGNVVVCHRFSNNSETIVANATDEVMLTGTITTRRLSANQVKFILGAVWPGKEPNIGDWLDKMFEILNKENTNA